MATLQAKLQEVITAQQAIQQKMAVFEEQVQKLSIASPAQLAARAEVVLPPVPIKRDKALAALTETEIVVLEMLCKEGRQDCSGNQRACGLEQGAYGAVDEENLRGRLCGEGGRQDSVPLYD